jgi:hypothetical protein
MRPTAIVSIAACLGLACFSRQTVRPDELMSQPVELSKGHLDVELASGAVQRFDAPVKATASGKTLLIKPEEGWAQLPLDRVVELSLVERSPNRTAALVLGSAAVVATVIGIVVLFVVAKPTFNLCGSSCSLAGSGWSPLG